MLSRFGKKKASLIVGIDIGSHSAKAVLLNKIDENYTLEGIVEESMPKGAVIDREIQDIDAVGKVIKKIRRRINKSVTEGAVAVSGQTVITKVIYMDVALTELELANQIEIEADSLIPYPLDEVSLDFESLEVNESDPSKINVLLSAARTESVEARVSVLEQGGFNTKLVDVESYALSRPYELILSQLPEDAANKVVAMVDIGAVMTLFSVTENGQHVYSRDQNFGGEQYTRSIVSYYNQSYDEAELAKVQGSLPESYQFEVLAPFHTTLLQQIRRAVQMFLTSTGKEKVDYLVISGGTALVEGIEKLLIEELGIHTVIAKPFSSMEIASDLDKAYIEKNSAKFMVAAGLALRGFSSCHI